MKSMIRTVISILFFAGWTLAALALHVVRLTDAPLGILPKDHLTLTNTYVDVRAWTPADVTANPDFVRRLVAADRADWLKHVVDPARGPIGDQLLDLIASAQPSETAVPLPPATGPTPTPAAAPAVAKASRHAVNTGGQHR